MAESLQLLEELGIEVPPDTLDQLFGSSDEAWLGMSAGLRVANYGYQREPRLCGAIRTNACEHIEMSPIETSIDVL